MDNIRKKMFQEMIDKKIFNQARENAFEYTDKALSRNVFPTDDAIEKLEIFDESFPNISGQANDIIEKLHKEFLLKRME